jgi:GNAT superfamily N-acetyltransferase
VASARATVVDAAGEEIGHVDFRRDGRVLEVRWVEIGPERRRWGLGMDAVRVLEAEAVERWDVREVRAQVPVGIGLALYFWLRLGYRPLAVEAVDGPRAGNMVMVRKLEEKVA